MRAQAEAYPQIFRRVTGRLFSESWTDTSPGGGNATVFYTHSYDNGGNLTKLRGYTLTPDPASDQLQSSNIPGYSSPVCNGAGEITLFNGATAVYSPLGQLSMISGSVNTSSGSSAYASSMVYDHLGRRAALSESLGSGSSLKKDVQFYIYDGNDLVYRQFTGTNGITALDGSDVTNDNGVLYLYGPTGLIMEFDRFGDYRTLLFDPQGSNVSSTMGLQSYAGTITGTTWFPIFYDSYGSQVWSPPNGSSPTKLNRATSQPFQYKGQYGYYTDGATGLDYCINRYYDPLTGRWLSRDPSGLDGGVNVYQYCDGDPVLGADPDGLDAGTSMLAFLSLEHPMKQTSASYFESWNKSHRIRIAPKGKPRHSLTQVFFLSLMFGGDPEGELAREGQVGAEFGASSEASESNFWDGNRPSQIPQNCSEEPAARGGGTKYFDPNNEHNSVRIDPNGPGYEPGHHVHINKYGQTIGVNGKPINNPSKFDPARHVPISHYRQWRLWWLFVLF